MGATEIIRLERKLAVRLSEDGTLKVSAILEDLPSFQMNGISNAILTLSMTGH